MTRQEKVKAIRAELKKNGIASRQVGITSKDCLYDESITVTIKDLTVDFELVNKIAELYEEVRWDDHAMEILQGCNTYVHVQYDYDIFRDEAKKYYDKAEELMRQGEDYAKGSSMTVCEKDNLEILYTPKWDNGNPEHIGIYKKPENWKELTCYCFESLKRLDARCKEQIAEALVIFRYQFGMNV